MAPLGDGQFYLLGTEFQIDVEDVGAGGARSLSMSMDPSKVAMTLLGENEWPVQDLFLGRVQGAVARYRAVHESDATTPMVDCNRLIQLSTSLSKSRRLEAAMSLSQTVPVLYPDDAEAWRALGLACDELGLKESAANTYRTCADRIPKDTSLDPRERAWLASDTKTRLHWLGKAKSPSAIK